MEIMTIGFQIIPKVMIAFLVHSMMDRKRIGGKIRKKRRRGAR